MKKTNYRFNERKLLIIIAIILGLVAFSLFGCSKKEPLNESAASKTVKDKSEISTTESTEKAETPASTVSSTAASTTAKPVVSTTASPLPTLNEKNVKSTFLPLIRYYSSLVNGNHYSVGVDTNNNYIDILPESWYQETGMTETGIWGVYKFKTVKSKKELKAVYRKYLSQSILNQYDIDKDHFIVEISGALYWVEGAYGTFDYDQNSIKLVSGENESYVVSIYSGISENYLGTEYFSVKVENGHFIIDKMIKEVNEHPQDYVIPNYKGIFE